VAPRGTAPAGRPLHQDLDGFPFLAAFRADRMSAWASRMRLALSSFTRSGTWEGMPCARVPSSRE